MQTCTARRAEHLASPCPRYLGGRAGGIRFLRRAIKTLSSSLCTLRFIRPKALDAPPSTIDPRPLTFDL
jgi:hypothetical protein